MIDYPFLMVDWIFVVVACCIALLSNKGCSYKHSSAMLAGQLLLTLGFSTLFIWAQVNYGSDIFYDGLHFYLPIMFLYFTFYHFIAKTGDRFLANSNLIIGAYHFGICFGIIINLNLNDYMGVSYEAVMVMATVLQLSLAFKGWLYGVVHRITDDERRRNNNRHHIV